MRENADRKNSKNLGAHDVTAGCCGQMLMECLFVCSGCALKRKMPSNITPIHLFHCGKHWGKNTDPVNYTCPVKHPPKLGAYNRVVDPQDDRQHLPQSASSRWETLDSKKPTNYTCHVEHPSSERLQGGNLVPEEHFAAAWNLSLSMGPCRIEFFPLDQDMPRDTDLTYFATYTATAQRRSESIRPLRALSARRCPTSLHLRKAMRPRAHRISKDMHVTLLRLLETYPELHLPQVFFLPENYFNYTATMMGLLVSRVPTNLTSFWAEACEKRHQERRRQRLLQQSGSSVPASL